MKVTIVFKKIIRIIYEDEHLCLKSANLTIANAKMNHSLKLHFYILSSVLYVACICFLKWVQVVDKTCYKGLWAVIFPT